MNNFENFHPPYNVETFHLDYWTSFHVSDDLAECFTMASSVVQWDEEMEDVIRIVDRDDKLL